MKLLTIVVTAFLFTLSNSLQAKEMSWEVLKTLEVDAKTKKNKILAHNESITSELLSNFRR